MIMKSIYEEEGIRIGGVNINNDTVLIADSEEKLQALMSTLSRSVTLVGCGWNIEYNCLAHACW